MSASYYTLHTALRPGWTAAHSKSLKLRGVVFHGWTQQKSVDPLRWKCPPHQAFANIEVRDKRQVGEFMTTYGPIGLEYETVGSSEPFEASMLEARNMQALLRLVWRNHDTKALWFQPGLEAGDFYLMWLMWPSKAADDLLIPGVWSFMRLLLGRDIATGRARRCRNKACKTPYFVAFRSDAVFCSQTCAVASAVRRFRGK